MTDHAEGEQDSRPNNKPEDLLELIMTADEFQKPEASPKKSSNISPQSETKLSQQTNQPPTDKPTECKHNMLYESHCNKEVRVYNQHGWRQLFSSGVTMHGNDG